MKTKVKILSVLFVALFVIFLVGITNEVQAIEVTEEYLQNVIDVLPDKMNIDIKESDCQESNSITSKKIEEILKNNNIDIKTIEEQGFKVEFGSYDGHFAGNTIEDFRTAHLTIRDNSYNVVKRKIIELEYTNTKNYNKADENFVKNLEIEKQKYYEVDIKVLDFNNFDKLWNVGFDMIAKNYEEQINDNTIKILADASAGGTDGGLNLYTSESGTVLGIFKNNILYDIVKMGHDIIVPVINVPSTVSDEELNQYVIEIITKSYKDYGEKITKIEKGTKNKTEYGLDYEIPNGYTIFANDLPESYIIIKREVANVEKEDTTTGIKLDTNTNVVPSDTKLISEKVEDNKILNVVKESLKEVSKKYTVYDITLLKDNKELQPNGKVKISIPVPSGYDKSKLMVYRIEENGDKIEYTVTVNDNYATFETDHFSTYVLAEKEQEDTTVTDNTNNEKDETPKTGRNSYIMLAISATVIAGISIILIKRKQK